jgi:molybdopterin synthase catalytic subunit
VELALLVKDDQAGAIVTFSGDVRNHDKGKGVLALNYEVHPSAQSVIERIAAEVAAKYEIINLATAHRYGAIPIGESAFVVAVSAAHRAPALACCEELVERVKAELPIWKFQEFSDGTTEWVNSA